MTGVQTCALPIWQAPDEVLAVANEVTLTDLDDGVAELFRTF